MSLFLRVGVVFFLFDIGHSSLMQGGNGGRT